jgi:hypothetical protein
MFNLLLKIFAGWVALLGAGAGLLFSAHLLLYVRLGAAGRLLLMSAVLGTAGWLVQKRNRARLREMRAAKDLEGGVEEKEAQG